MKKTMIGGALRRGAAALACLAAGVLPAAAANEARPLEPGSEYLMVANYPNNLNVVDLASESVYKTCPLPDAFGPGTTQIAPDRRTAYILNNRFGTIYGIDLDTCRLTFRAEMSQALQTGALAVVSLSFLAVGREGVETALFMVGYAEASTFWPLAGLLARAVVVIDKAGKVVYTQLVPEITEEPDYDAAVEAVKAL